MSFRAFHAKVKKNQRTTLCRSLVFALFVCFALAGGALAWAETDVVGTVSEQLSAFSGLSLEEMTDSRTKETTLGSAAADAVRLECGTQLAIVNGGDFYLNLPTGSVSYADVRAVFAEDRALAAAEYTPRELAELIELGVSHVELKDNESIERHNAHGAFPQVSGFSYKYDVSAEPGSRLVSITLDDGTVLDLGDDETVYTLAGTEYMFSGGYGLPAHASETRSATLSTALADYIASGIELNYHEADARVTAIGSRDSRPFTNLPRGAILVAVALLIAVIMAAGGRLKRIGLFKKPGER